MNNPRLLINNLGVFIRSFVNFVVLINKPRSFANTMVLITNLGLFRQYFNAVDLRLRSVIINLGLYVNNAN
jgi:hypothetical protein